MSNIVWKAPVSFNEACRRASGRRCYHAQRRIQRFFRRLRVLELWRDEGMSYGAQARWARELGVSEATISRDVAAWVRHGNRL
jgi:hypothetical protein